ncbi:MAG: Elongation factor P [Parcubacteria group bacterium GW2011_GWC1_42_11]|uniref:Elongation factor P n=1 Tax=Candidatus Nomurabacteria bacterium GW2011_GWC2_42_20 TaxID=1618756 RepID=A0A0G0ZEB2_9BACT|nr:MAG: Elongation factor P [Parcubacteria group bacterium GW2011_GWC1_42_11]KKS47060.1 MAG: Elongation factor P [Candidatus Nomurabacteria bacterium GW2011_GWC2_42_20]KKT08647.1 MAG: Elongation factor P [Candidatus Nomurabacteria bacterium GW2011_GWB1_43_20]HBH71257.1 elongation factor P [Candidatus Yonathbacteria bacterium]
MAIIDYNEITPKKCIVLKGEPYEVMSSHVAQKQKRRPTNQTKLKHLITGRVVEETFQQSDRVEEADIETKEIKYLYTGKGESWFCSVKDPSDRFSVKTELLDGKEGFLKANTVVSAMIFDEKIIGIRLPIKVELLVKEAPPAVRGNTVSGGSNTVTLETGATILVPMFIHEGDLIRVNTETGMYAERVDKK